MKVTSVVKSAVLVFCFGCFVGAPRSSRATAPSIFSDSSESGSGADSPLADRLIRDVHRREADREERRVVNDVVTGCNDSQNSGTSESAGKKDDDKKTSLGAADDPQPSLKPGSTPAPEPSNTY